MWKHRLNRELALILAIKLGVLYGIWLAFFDVPAGHSNPTAAQVSDAVIGTPTAPQRCKETRHDC